MHSICDLLSKMFSKISTTFTLVILVLHLKNAMKNAIVIENPKIQNKIISREQIEKHYMLYSTFNS